MVGRLGPGGMGDAFLAEAGQRWVVVKAVRLVGAGSAELSARLRHEVEALRRIDSPHVARLLAAEVDGPRPWFAMEFIPGLTLGQRVAQYGPVPVADLPAFGLAVAEGIAAVHAVGIKHRDLKPDNVVLSGTGPRLIDFGAADLEGATRLTALGAVIGTVEWMSPEQVSAAEITAAVDVHAWGLLMLHAATGEEPFAAETPVACMYRVLHEMPVVPEFVGPRLASLMRAALAKNASGRPSVPELIAELRACVPGPGEFGIDGSGRPGGGSTMLLPARRARPARPLVVSVGLGVFAATVGVAAVVGGASLLGVSWWDGADPGPTSSATPVAGPSGSSRPTPSGWALAEASLGPYQDALHGQWSPAIPGGRSNGVRPDAVAAQLTKGELVVHTFIEGGWREAQRMAGPSQGAMGMSSQVVDTTGGGRPDLLLTLSLDDGSSTGAVVLNYGRVAVVRDASASFRYVPGLEMVGEQLRDGEGAALVWDGRYERFTRFTPSPTTPTASGSATRPKPVDWPAYEFDGPAEYDVCQAVDFPLPGQLLRVGSGDAGGPESMAISGAQAGLRSLNYGTPPIDVTGTFDEATRVALLTFQQGNSIAPAGTITVDGVLGPETWAELHRRVNLYAGNCPS